MPTDDPVFMASHALVSEAESAAFAALVEPTADRVRGDRSDFDGAAAMAALHRSHAHLRDVLAGGAR